MIEKPHYVILTVDAKPDTRDDDSLLFPPTIGDWQQTEGDEQYEYDYLGPEYRNGKHRKWVAQLTEEELDRWLDAECWGPRENARENATPTMGMITELGFLPAYALYDDPMAWNIGGVTQVIDRQAYVGEYALSDERPPDYVVAALAPLYGWDLTDEQLAAERS